MPKQVRIGYTWYVPETWGSRMNPECKILLHSFAFEELKLNRVELVVDSRNLRSRAAVKKLGATEEGVLRQHRVLDDGYIRHEANIKKCRFLSPKGEGQEGGVNIFIRSILPLSEHHKCPNP